jgi:hypothetical protein
MVAGLHGPQGEIRSLSNPTIPGFVAIGIDNPPILVAEEVAHEATHVVLSAHIALNSDFEAFTDDRFGILSPFSNSVRTIERVLHGILSYAAVQMLWRALAAHSEPEYWVGSVGRPEARQIAKRRVQVLDARLLLAITCLSDGAGSDVCRRARELAHDLLKAELPPPPVSNCRRKAIVGNAGYSTEANGLTPIERAELVLAVHGKKASRLTMRNADIARKGFPLVAVGPVVASNWAFHSISDPRLGGFSNVGGDRRHILDADAESEVHLYVHSSSMQAQRTAIFDWDDRAGELLGIPKCCRDWYAREWPRAFDGGGDLFAVMAREASCDGHSIVAKECDASAMYRDGGLCWHFPCSPKCSETIAVVRSRRKFLENHDPALLHELDKAHRSAITILGDGSYEDREVEAHGAIVVYFE